ncbi:hypothetical protein Ahy_B01g055183 isoform F [Arachis hypogaea]|uniref:Uncharacterized protein n=1 Tax=Arachis hypogaea TaxID=3818 RepID=A0A445AVG6_ARAHY|nr:hypothetical protein Ahy_B01g055183 isoform F [Arachis hypogaea]
MKASGTEIPNNKKTRSNIVPNGMALEDPWNQTRAFSKKNKANAVAGNIKAVLRSNDIKNKIQVSSGLNYKLFNFITINIKFYSEYKNIKFYSFHFYFTTIKDHICYNKISFIYQLLFH